MYKIERGQQYITMILQSKVDKTITAVYNPIAMVWNIYKGYELVLTIDQLSGNALTGGNNE